MTDEPMTSAEHTEHDLAEKFARSLQPLAVQVAERLPYISIATGFIAAGVSISTTHCGAEATADWLRAIADDLDSIPDTRGTMGRA